MKNTRTRTKRTNRENNIVKRFVIADTDGRPFKGILTISHDKVKITKINGASPWLEDLISFIASDRDVLRIVDQTVIHGDYRVIAREGMSGAVTWNIFKVKEGTSAGRRELLYTSMYGKACLDIPLVIPTKDLKIIFAAANRGIIIPTLTGMMAEHPKRRRRFSTGKFIHTPDFRDFNADENPTDFSF